MTSVVIAGEAEWNRSRAVVVSFLMVFGALLAGYYFYQHAVRYIQSYDVNCAAPGVLVSEIWSADFVIQGLTGKQFLQDKRRRRRRLSWRSAFRVFVFLFFFLSTSCSLIANAPREHDRTTPHILFVVRICHVALLVQQAILRHLCGIHCVTSGLPICHFRVPVHFGFSCQLVCCCGQPVQ